MQTRSCILFCLLACCPCRGEEGKARHEPKTIVSPGKSLSIHQQYQGQGQ